MLLRFRPLFGLGAACLIVGAVLRALLWLEFGRRAGVAAVHLPAILAGGLVNDLVVTACLLSPFALYLAALPEKRHRSRANRILVSVGTWLTLAALVYLAVVEIYFFEEFDARFNLVAFDYLAYPTEVVGDVWHEYPVLRSLLAAALVASAGTWWLRRRARGDGPPAQAQGRCFPGSHASMGFSLMAFYFVMRKRRPRLARGLLAGAMALGTIFSIGQQARGAHFLSHDLTSAAIAWYLLLGLRGLLLESAEPAATRLISPASCVQPDGSAPPRERGLGSRDRTHPPHARRRGAGIRSVLQCLLRARLPLCPAPAQRRHRSGP